MAKINLLLQLQRQKLLQENKERAGQNRSAKEDRSRTTKTADKASAPPATTPAAQAKQEEDARKKRQLSGGSLDLYKRRRPAATEDDEFRVFGISNINPYDWPEKIESVSIPWTATYDRLLFTGVVGQTNTYTVDRATVQKTNGYRVVEREWFVGFNEDFGNSVQLITTPRHTLPGVITALDWYFHQSSNGYSGYSNDDVTTPPVARVVASPPQLTPHNSSWFTNKQTISVNDKPLTSSDGRYIYHSTWYTTGRPRPAFFDAYTGTVLDNIFNARPILADYYPSDSINTNGFTYYGNKIQRTTPDIQSGRSLNYSDDDRFFGEFKGLYWRYDTETPEAVPELTVKSLSYPGDGTAADQRNTLSNFLDNLYPDDPYYKWWKFRYGTGYNNAFRFLSPVTTQIPKEDTYLRWPQNLVYYPDTGQALFTKALNTGAPTVYSKESTANMHIATVMQLFPYLTEASNTHENMLSNGWEVEDVDTSSTVFLDPNFRVAHRAT